MSDVYHFQTTDGGEIELINGIFTLGQDLATALYYSMFGGNSDDPGESDTTKTWWPNLGETDPARQYRSKTQYLLQGIPATTSNLVRIKNAVEQDIQWAVDDGTLEDLVVSVAIPALNRVYIRIEATVGTLELVESWEMAA